MDLSVSAGFDTREQDFAAEWTKLEQAANTAAGEAQGEVKLHQRIKHGLGLGAILFGAVASASAVLALDPRATAGAALVATISTTAQQFQNPFAKEVDHLDRAARYRDLARRIRYLGL